MKSILFKKFFFENQLMLFVLNAGAEFTAFNESLEDFLVYRVSIKGQKLWTIAAEERSRVSLEAAFHRAKDGRASVTRILMKSSAVHFCWAEIQFSQALSVDNEEFIVGSILDVTREELIEEKVEQHERSLVKLTAELKELNNAKSAFLSMAAHDLRTPLHKISFIADMLLSAQLTPEKQKELHGIILRSSDAMKELIDDLLSITQVESGRISLKKREVSVQDYLTVLEHEYALLAETKGSKLVVECPKENVCVKMDPDRIRQVLINLLSNALKFSPPGSTITLRAVKDNHLVRFEVLDQGPGVPEDEKDLLFVPFQKLSPRPTSGEPSSGLGLAISKQLVDVHNGQIGVESIPEGGSNFWIALPV